MVHLRIIEFPSYVLARKEIKVTGLLKIKMGEIPMKPCEMFLQVCLLANYSYSGISVATWYTIIEVYMWCFKCAHNVPIKAVFIGKNSTSVNIF